MRNAAITKFDDQTEIQSNNLERLDLDHEQQNSERLSYGTNEIEIRVFGLQRSGNHALITWITAQYPKKSWCFLNNIKHGNYDPFQFAASTQTSGLGEDLDLESLRAADKHLLIYSYEDVVSQMQPSLDFLDSALDATSQASHRHQRGSSRNIFDVIVIRDPFNYFASRLKRDDGFGGAVNVPQLVYDWKRMAQYALKAIEHPVPGLIVGNFNQWFADRNYREELSRRLNGVFSDETKDDVHFFGGGSSFESAGACRLPVVEVLRKWKKAFHPKRYLRLQWYLQRVFFAPKGSQMKVTQRWMKMIADERYRQIFRDPEIAGLSHQLFGYLPGTSEFIASIA